MSRPLDPCGTIGAHNRHVREHQPIDDACRRAWNDYKHEAKPLTARVALPRLADAACATPAGMRMFADITPENVPDAREICRACPVQRTCLQWGVLYEADGLWGGYDAAGRRQLRQDFGIQLQPIRGFDFAVRGN